MTSKQTKQSNKQLFTCEIEESQAWLNAIEAIEHKGSLRKVNITVGTASIYPQPHTLRWKRSSSKGTE